MARYSGCMSYSAEKHCAHCGGYTFIADITKWVYKTTKPGGGYHWFCSWSCLCAHRRKHEKPPKEKKEPKKRTYIENRYPNSLRAIRECVGIPLKEMAELLNYTNTSQVSRIEKGYVPIPARVSDVLCELYGCGADDLTAEFDADRWEEKKNAYPPR